MYKSKQQLQCLVACILFSVSILAQASIEGHQLITKMLDQVDQVNYQGNFVYMHNGKLDSMRIVHGIIDGEIKEKLTSLSGEPREVMRDEEEVTCIWPLRQLVTVDPSSSYHGIPTIVPKELGSLEENYQVVMKGVNRVAGQYCQMLAIKPVDHFRYGYKLCIQPETGMLLRSQMINPRGRLLEEVMFTELEYLEAVNDDQFKPVNDTEGFTLKERNFAEANEGQKLKSNWRFSQLPPGFSVSKINQRRMKTSDEPVQHMVISDGVASVSVFII
ncbi:MAG: MucB/RseB C-terminal domain-containing protein, partial [Pseudomonadota bacterium]